MMKKLLCMLLCLLMLASVLVGCTQPPVGGGDTEAAADGGDSDGGTSAKPTQKTFEEMTAKEKALYLWNKTGSYGENSDGVTATLSATAQGEMAGSPFDMTMRGSMLVRQNYYYEEATNIVTVGNGTYQTNISMKSGYVDGKMFSYTETDGEGKGVYSSLSATDYLAYNKEKAEDANMALTESMVGEYTLTVTDEGDYEVTLSSLSKEGMTSFEDAFGSGQMFFSIIGSDPIDAEIAFAVDKDLKPIACTIRFVFEKETGKTAPVLVMETEYADATDETVWPTVSFDDWRDVGDLRAIERVERALNKMGGASSLSMEYYEYAKSARENQTLAESEITDTVTMANDENGYTFRIEESNGQTITYRDGEMTLKKEGQADKTQEIDDSSAMVFFNDRYIGFGDFKAARVESVKQEGDTWVFTLADIDLSPFADVFEPTNTDESDVRDAKGTVKVTMKDGKIVSMRYDASFKLPTSNGVFDLVYVNEFKNAEYEK